LIGLDATSDLRTETWVFKKPNPGGTWPFCQTRNPGLRAAETWVLGLFFGCVLYISTADHATF